MVSDNSRNILVISAHPDDLELGASFALMKYVRDGYDVYSVLVTDGEKGGDSNLRIKESEEAAKILGIKDIFRLKFSDANLPGESELVRALEPLYYKYSPEVVITHSSNDRHQDHVQTANASRIAFRKALSIIMYRSISGSVDFSPHLFYIGDDDDLENKLRVCGCHRTQVEKGIIDLEVIRAHAIFWGNVYNLYEKKYAEPFEVNHFGISVKK
jgi:LmbE family N-acetylglucosaminyl deacetylase